MRHFKQILNSRRFCLPFLIIFLLSVSVTSAQNKVVVVPLFDDQTSTGPPSPVPKTGQTTSHAAGDDGDLEKGLAWPIPRFTINADGTVTDNLTGLIWLRDANCINNNYPEFDNDGTDGDGSVTWQHALDFIAGINDRIYTGCGAGYKDWRLPNIKELLSLLYYEKLPALTDTSGTGEYTEGEPFINALGDTWTSNRPRDSSMCWIVSVFDGEVFFGPHDGGSGTGPHDYNRVWPVRGGN